MAAKITVTVGASGKASDSYQIISDSSRSAPVRIVAQKGMHYKLTDNATGFAPEAVATKRLGKDLAISFDGDIDAPELIIEGYYSDAPANADGTPHTPGNGILTGQYAGDGKWYAYVPDSGQPAEATSMLADQLCGNQVLGGEPLPNAFPPLLALLGVAALAGIAAMVGGKDEKPAPPKPNAGSLDAPDDSNNPQPVIKGKGATPGAEATVVVKDKDGKVVDTIKTTVKPDGSYEVTPTKPIPDGPYTAEATVTKDGQSDQTSDNGSVDTVPPAKATVEVIDDVAPQTGPVPDGGSTNDTSPTIKGKGEPDATVRVEIDGKPPVTAVVDKDGNWQITDPTLGEGEHTVKVTQTDKAGNTSEPTETKFTVDTQVPKVDKIELSDTDLKVGETSTVTITFNEKVSGFTTDDITAENGTISNLQSSDGGKTWTATFTPNTDIEDTTNVITVKKDSYTDAAGNLGDTGTSDNYTIDTKAPQVDKIEMDDTDLKVGETATITFTFTEPVEGVEAGDINAPHGTVGTPTSSDGGKTWTVTFTPTAGASANGNTVTVKDKSYTDKAGNPGEGGGGKVPVNYDINTQTSDAIIIIEAIADDTGTPDDFKTSDTTLTVSGTLSKALLAGEAVQVSNDGGVTWKEATVSGTTWSYVDPTEHTEGTFTYTARVVDNAGNEGSKADREVEIDTSGPTQTVTITTVVDDQLPQPGGVSGNVDVANGGKTNDTTPLVKGTLSAVLADGTTPGSTAEQLEVWVSVNGGAAIRLGNATVSGTDWTYQDNTGYQNGDKVVYTAKVVDAVGHEGGLSGEYAVGIDLVNPEFATDANTGLKIKPTVVNSNPGNNPGDDYLGDRILVRVKDGDDVANIRVFDSQGKELSFSGFERIGTSPSFWLNGFNPQLKVGDTVIVRVYDAAGNVSQESIPIYFQNNLVYVDDIPDPKAVIETVTGDVNPTITGRIEVTTGADKIHSVKLYNGEHYIGDAVLDKAAGTWTYSNPNYTFATGVAHKLTAHVIIEGPQGPGALGRVEDHGTYTLDLTGQTATHATVSEYANGKQDVIVLSDVLAANSGKLVLLQGDGNDKVEAADSWIRISADGESTTIGGVQYTVWHDGVSNANVLIQSGIEVI